MSTVPSTTSSAADLAAATMEFVLAFGAWVQKASMASAGESVARLRLLNELHCNGPRKMADLAASLGVTPRNVTALVDALEAERMVQRAPHPTDRRVTIIEITGGSATVARQVEELRAAITALFADVSEDDRAAFERVMARLLEKMGPPDPRGAA